MYPNHGTLEIDIIEPNFDFSQVLVQPCSLIQLLQNVRRPRLVIEIIDLGGIVGFSTVRQWECCT